MRDGIPCFLASAVVAGSQQPCGQPCWTLVKTRFMNAPEAKYSGVLDCARQTALKEGSGAFYRGFRASCLRLVSWNIVLRNVSYEQLKLATQRYYNKQ